MMPVKFSYYSSQIEKLQVSENMINETAKAGLFYPLYRLRKHAFAYYDFPRLHYLVVSSDVNGDGQTLMRFNAS